MEIGIEFNDSEVSALLTRLMEAGDMEPALSEVGMTMEARASMRFETETDPDGVPWAPWAESTRKSYPKDGNHRLLNRYGDMLASLSHQVDPQSVVWGFGQAYAWFHEMGNMKLPRRGILLSDPVDGQLAQDDEQTVVDIFNRHLQNAVDG